MKNVKSFFLSFVDYQMFVQRSLMILQIIVFVLALLTKKSLGITSAFIAITAVMYAYFTFCLVNEVQALKQFKVCSWTVAFAISEFLNGYFMTTFEKFPKFIYIALDVVIIVIFYFLSHPSEKEEDEIRKAKIQEFITNNIYAESDMGEKDTYMGFYLDNGKPNIVPYKDRFLHTLVLGVTGCGKTSQSLLPMVAKDIKCKDLGVVCLDPKGDFAEKVYAMAVLEGRENDTVYFNPTLKECPYFNPLVGDEDSVSECLVTTFKKLENETQQFFANMNEMLMRRCIKVVKRTKGDSATLNDINVLMFNTSGLGKEMIKNLTRQQCTDLSIEQENQEIASWFLTDYYSALSGGRNATKTYEQCSGVRNQVSKLLANSLIKQILCPDLPFEDLPFDKKIDFDEILKRGGVLAMSSAQGELRELGTFIGYFLILSFESAVFRREGDEDSRRGVIFYVDEFQKYANDGYNDLLTQGRSYRVASVLATQTRAGIAANSGPTEGKVLVDVVSSNCRNKIVYPGGGYEDASYYSKEFGERKVIKERKSVSKKRTLFSSIDKSTQSESLSQEEKMEPYFYPIDIMKRPFGQAVCQVVKNNTVQDPVAVKLKFIDKKLNKNVNKFIEEEIRPRHIKFKYSEEEEEQENKHSINRMTEYTLEDIPEIPFGDVEGDYSEEFKGLK